MKRGQKNRRNIAEGITILQTQIHSLCFSMNSLSKKKTVIINSPLENLWISTCVFYCSIVSTLLRRYLLIRSNIVRQFEKFLTFSSKKKRIAKKRRFWVKPGRSSFWWGNFICDIVLQEE